MSELADDMADLLGALRDVAAEHNGLTEALRGMAGQPGHPAECRACPVCQGLALLRQTRPEVFEHLAAAVEALALAVRALVSPSGSADQATAPPSTTRSASSPESAEPVRPRIELIEIE